MNEARILPHSFPLALPLSAACASEPLSLGDELSDNDLEQVVGGLARARDSASHRVRAADASYTIAIASVHEITHRASA